MENFRSMSCREGRMMQFENNGGKSGGPPANMQDLRSYSTSHTSSYMQVHPQPSSSSKDHSKPHFGASNSCKKNRAAAGGSVSASSKGWSLSDPELQRKKRVASYKVYAVEGKMKGSFRKSFRWIKHTASQVVHGWW